jgi:murein L,D-transpeptidase YcbB/YkuD
MRQSILGIWTQGLNPKTYWTDEMEKDFAQGMGQKDDLKYHTQKNFLAMLRHLSIGSVDPKFVGPDIKLKKKEFIEPSRLHEIVFSANFNTGAIVEELAPQNEPYFSTQAAMKALYPICNSGRWQNISESKVKMSLNSKNSVIFNIKQRLVLLGYKIKSIDDLFDDDLLMIVNDIQSTQRWNPDGFVSPGGRFWRFLNTSCFDRIRQIQADMEKLRWFPQRFEDRFAFVNLAFSYFYLFENKPEKKVALSFRIINGRPSRKSPTMRDEIVKIIFNPFWVVPPKIFYKDKVVEIRNLPENKLADYFIRNRFEVWDKVLRKKINPLDVNWGSEEYPKYTGEKNIQMVYLRQRPFIENALGVIKFELTNSLAVFMHDTNQPELFQRQGRMRSSGCIRLEKAFDLAEYLLSGTEWTRKEIEAIVAKPGDVVKDSTVITLSKSLPIYMANITSEQSRDGVLRFAPDSYGQNAKIIKSMRGLF